MFDHRRRRKRDKDCDNAEPGSYNALVTEDLVRRLAGQLENGVDLLLDYLPGRARGQRHGRFFQGCLCSSESLKSGGNSILKP